MNLKNFSKYAILSTFVFLSSQKVNAMTQQQSQKLIEDFYAAFNAKQLDKLFALLSDDVKHEMNDSGVMKGKAAFKQLMQDSVKYYDEQVSNPIFMVSEDGKHVSTRFTFKGRYISTDESQIPATGQPYQATAINYFEIENGKITTAICWYNNKDWMKQVSKVA